MFVLRYYTTRSSDWQEGCRSDDPRVVVAKFDEVSGKSVALELFREDRRVLRLGLDRGNLMKLAVWGCRVRTESAKFKERYKKLRARGIKDVQAGRNALLDALV